jgi:hypothetical protein
MDTSTIEDAGDASDASSSDEDALEVLIMSHEDLQQQQTLEPQEHEYYAQQLATAEKREKAQLAVKAEQAAEDDEKAAQQAATELESKRVEAQRQQQQQQRAQVVFRAIASLTVYNLGNYTLGTKAPLYLASGGADTAAAHLKFVAQNFALSGTVRYVEALLVVHLHRHPHVLVLKSATAFRLYVVASCVFVYTLGLLFVRFVLLLITTASLHGLSFFLFVFFFFFFFCYLGPAAH